MNSEQINGVVRTFIAWCAGFVPSTMVNPELKSQIMGVTVAGLVALWSWYSNRRKPVV